MKTKVGQKGSTVTHSNWQGLTENKVKADDGGGEASITQNLDLCSAALVNISLTPLPTRIWQDTLRASPSLFGTNMRFNVYKGQVKLKVTGG